MGMYECVDVCVYGYTYVKNGKYECADVMIQEDIHL